MSKTNSVLHLKDTIQTFVFYLFPNFGRLQNAKILIFHAHNEAKCSIIPKRHNTNLDI